MLYVTEAGFKKLAGIGIKVWSFLFNIFYYLIWQLVKKQTGYGFVQITQTELRGGNSCGVKSDVKKY